jgi:hypothetical protein
VKGGLGCYIYKNYEMTKGVALPDLLTILTLHLRFRCTVRTFSSSHTAIRFTTINTLRGCINPELFRTGQRSLEISDGIVTRLRAGVSGLRVPKG